MMFFKKKIIAFLLVILVTLGFGGFRYLFPNPAFAATTFQGGNSFLVSNTNNPAWTDPVDASVGDIVEFHLEIDNTGAETANNVNVRVEFPTNISGGSPLVTTIRTTADNAAEMVDTATVNVPNTSTTKSLVYFPGHAVLIKHPGNVTTQFEAIAGGGAVSIGNLDPGGNVFAEVLFKAQVVEIAVPTETPTPTPTGTVAPTPTNTPTPTPTGTVTPTPTPTLVAAAGNVISCPAGFVSVVSGSNIICMQQVQNQTQNTTSTSNASTGAINITASGGSATSNNTNTVTQTAPPVAQKVAAAPVTVVPQVTQLPKTGLPLAAWILSGLIPGGFGVRRLGGRGEGKGGDARYIWQKREFDK